MTDHPDAVPATPLPRPLQTALALWFGLFLALSVRTALRPADHTCFTILDGGARHWWADEPVYANYRPHLDYFRYPPIFAILLSPLAWMGLILGGIGWNAINFGVFAAGLWRFRRDVLPADWSAARQTVFLMLATVGGLRALWNGQCNALVTGLMLLGAAALVRQRWWPAACWLGSSVLIKLTPLPLVLLLLVLRPRQLAPRLCVVLVVGSCLPFLTRPAATVVSQYDGMVAQMRETATERWPGFRDAWTVWQVGCAAVEGSTKPPDLVAPLDSRAYRLIQRLAALATLAWCCLACRRWSRSAAWQVLVTLGSGCSWILLFGPAVEHPTYVFLAPLLAWATLERGFSVGRPLICLSALLILVLGWGSLARPWQDKVPLVLTILPIGTTLFTLWLMAYTWVGSKKEQPEGQIRTPLAA